MSESKKQPTNNSNTEEETLLESEEDTANASSTKKKATLNSYTQVIEDVLEKFMIYNYGQMLLREREHLFEKIHAEEDLEPQIQFFAVYSLLFSAIYGGLLGTYAGGLQIITGAIKVPLLLFGTL